MKTLGLVAFVVLGLVLGGQATAQPTGRIAFHHCPPDRDLACAIVVTDADGSNPVTVAQGIEPAWSPDGSRLAFVRPLSAVCDAGWGYPVGCQLGDVLVMDIGTGQVANLTGRRSLHYSPAWSPDGSQIAFASDRDDAYYYGWGDLYVMNADGSGIRRLTEVGFVERIAWSPDGGRITFTCYVDAALDYPPQVCQINSDGSGLTPISGPGVFDAAWSADGETIAVGSFAVDPGGSGEIAVMSPDGTGVRRVTVGAQVTVGADGARPAWSPDAERIAFSSGASCDGRGSGGVWVVNADGTGLRCIGSGSNPAWVP